MFLLTCIKRRCIQSYHRTQATLAALINGEGDPIRFRRIFRIDYDTFVLLMRVLYEDRNLEYPWKSKLQRWYKNRQKNSTTPAMAVAAGILYITAPMSICMGAHLLRMATNTYDKLARLVIDELNRKEREVICMSNRKMVPFLKCRRLNKPMPGAVYALDGTHVRVKNNDAYNSCYNYKNHVTMNVPIVCDWNYNIVFIFPNYTGRTHDSPAWMTSPLGVLMSKPETNPLREGSFIVADEGYACIGSVLTPHSKDLTPEKLVFNAVLKSSRLIIENTINMWKRRVPSLKTGMHGSTHEVVASEVNASAVFHQFAKFYEDSKENNPSKTEYANGLYIVPEEFIGKTGFELRDAVTQYFANHFKDDEARLVALQ